MVTFGVLFTGKPSCPFYLWHRPWGWASLPPGGPVKNSPMIAFWFPRIDAENSQQTHSLRALAFAHKNICFCLLWREKCVFGKGRSLRIWRTRVKFVPSTRELERRLNGMRVRLSLPKGCRAGAAGVEKLHWDGEEQPAPCWGGSLG